MTMKTASVDITFEYVRRERIFDMGQLRSGGGAIRTAPVGGGETTAVGL